MEEEIIDEEVVGGYSEDEFAEVEVDTERPKKNSNLAPDTVPLSQ